MKQTSLETRSKIIQLFQKGKSKYSIAKTFNISTNTVFNIVKNYQNHEKTLKNLPKPGRPLKLDKRGERALLRLCKKHPFWTSKELKDEFFGANQGSSSYVRKVLVRNCLKGRLAVRKPLVSLKNKKKRVFWCREKQNLPFNFWENVTFSDETTLELHPHHRIWVRAPPGKSYDPLYTQKTVAFGGKKLLLWGYIKFNGERGLVKIDKTINSDIYIKILEQNLLPNMFLGEVFQHDNAPPHTSKKTADFMFWNGVTLLENWPPQSPDVNIIENMWRQLKKKVHARGPRTEEELWTYAKEEFFKISNFYIKQLFLSIPRRLKAVLNNKGYPTKY